MTSIEWNSLRIWKGGRSPLGSSIFFIWWKIRFDLIYCPVFCVLDAYAWQWWACLFAYSVNYFGEIVSEKNRKLRTLQMVWFSIVLAPFCLPQHYDSKIYLLYLIMWYGFLFVTWFVLVFFIWDLKLAVCLSNLNLEAHGFF